MKDIPPTYFYACIIGTIALWLVAFLLDYFGMVLFSFSFIGFPLNLIGLLIMAFGFYLVVSPYYIFMKHNTPENFSKSKCVVCTGWYKFSRNPMYIGGIIFLLGLTVLVDNYFTLIFPVIFFLIMDRKFIPFEEKKMEKEQGKAYLDYKKKVRRWI